MNLPAKAIGRLMLLLACLLGSPRAGSAEPELSDDVHRSPVDVALSTNGRWLVSANQTSGSVSLVDLQKRAVVDEHRVGGHPTAVVRVGDTERFVAVSRDSGEIVLFTITQGVIEEIRRTTVGLHPVGAAISSSGARLWVALSAADQIVELSLPALVEERRIDVGKQPRYLAVNPQGTRLAVGTSGDRGVSVVDLERGELLYIDRFIGLNIGHLQSTRDGTYAYYPWMVYRNNPITKNNIQLGWVLASRIARSRLDRHERREAMSLDPRGQAIADPHGLRLTSDEAKLVVSASGSQELLVYLVEGLPLEAHGGPDHVDPELLADSDRFYRIGLGGRPMGLRIAPDDHTVYVANYMQDTVQVVDLDSRRITGAISLGGPTRPDLQRQGEAIFYDGRRSLDQWYSCHTCHYEGGSNSVAMDTWNDGSPRTVKTVLPLFHLADTGPWTWHGWQTDLRDAMHKSLTSTMQGSKPTETDVDALLAFLTNLKRPPNPLASRLDPGSVSRGRDLFYGERAGCSSCHQGSQLTDGQVHDVGTGHRRDQYDGFNTPSLKGVYQKVVLMHHGKADSLETLLRGLHAPEQVAGAGPPLTDQELADLIAFLKTL